MNHRSVLFITYHHQKQNTAHKQKSFYSWIHRCLFIIVFGSCLLVTQPVFAQWSSDTDINTAVSITGTSVGWPAIIPCDNGSVIIVWNDLRNGTNNSDIFAQRLNAAGQPEWTMDGLAICTAPNSQLSPLIVPDGTGGAILAWFDYRNGLYSNIYAQHIKPNGTIGWITNGLPVCPQPSSQGFPSILVNDAGNTIITWEDARDNSQIYAQMIAPDGTLKWAADGVNICPANHAKNLPTIISSGDQGVIIAWLDYRRNDRSDIYAQRISKDGVIEWQADGVEIGRATGWQRGPQVVSDNTGGAIVTWDDYRSGSNATPNTYAQRVNSEGITQWTQYGVAVCSTANRQYWSSLASDGAGGAIITWKDNRYGNSGDIYAQHLNASGIGTWNKNGVIISSAHSGQSFPAIASIDKRGAVVAWIDARNGGDPGNSIYVQNVNKDGKIGCFTPVITRQPLTAQTILQGTTAASLTVAVTGEQLNYQWYSNTTASTTGAVNLYPAGTDASFTPSAAKEGTLYYYCIATSNCDTLYSDYAQVTVNIPITKLQVKVSPNPTESFFNVTVKNPDDRIIYIRLFDMLGRLVEYQQGISSQSFKLAGKLAAGMYLIEVRQGEEVVVIKAVKQ